MKKLLQGMVCCCAGLLASAAQAAEPNFNNGNSASESYFSVPFFIEPTGSGGRLWSVFTMKRPAILHSYMGSCSGPTDSGLLQFDGGPRGVAGTVAAGHDSNTAVVLGSTIILNQLPVRFQATATSSGTTYLLPPTVVDLPIKSDVEFLVFPINDTFIQCSITLIFKTIE